MSRQPHETIWMLTTSVVASRALHVVAELGVADYVGDDPTPAKELATRCDADEGALDRVLRLLAAHGIFAFRSDGYVHTDESRLLRSDHPMSMRAFPRMIGMPLVRQSFAELEHSVQSGAPSVEVIDPAGMWGYLQTHTAEAEIFGQAMAAKAAADIGAVLSSYDFSQFRRIADIGGGRGHLLRAVLDAAPASEGILFDLPPVADAVVVGDDRLSVQGGDFFVDPLPAADAYILMEVIHDWADAEAAQILRAIRHAAPAGATVLVIEGVVADEQPDPRVHTLDVIMLALTGGRERSAGQLAALLDAAGFVVAAVLETPGPMRIVEARAE